jgi:hypothetical protein
MIARTLVAGVDHVWLPETSEMSARKYDAWEGYIQKERKFPRVRDGGQAHEDEEIRRATQYNKARSDACFNRSIFLTATGRLGVGPKAMHPFDNIAILWGCEWPVVLRAVPDTNREYTVVGLAYVDGIMFGEAVEEQKAAGKADELFLLR